MANIIGIPILGLVIAYLFTVLVYQFALFDFFVTIVREGEIKAVMVNGVLDRMLLSYKGKKYEGTGAGYERWKIIPDPAAPTSPPSLLSRVWSLVNLLQNVHWVGPPPSAKVYTYRFTWKAPGGVPHDEDLGHVFARATFYEMTLRAVELQGGIPVDIVVNFLIEASNPAKMLFAVHHWLEATLQLMGPELITQFNGMTYKKLTGGKQTVGDKLIKDKEIKAAIDKADDLFGIKVIAIKVASIDPPPEFLSLTMANFEATQRAEAAREAAKGERDAAITVAEGHARAAELRGEGEAKAITAIATAATGISQDALAVLGFDAITRSGGRVSIVAPSLRIAPLITVDGSTPPTSNP